MTKREAAEKVAKLVALANGTSSPHEADTAREQAKKMYAEYGLTTEDLESGKLAAAYDELVDVLGSKISSIGGLADGMLGSGTVVTELARALKSKGEVDKASSLRRISVLVKAVCLVYDHPDLRTIKNTLHEVAHKHGVSL